MQERFEAMYTMFSAQQRLESGLESLGNTDKIIPPQMIDQLAERLNEFASITGQAHIHTEIENLRRKKHIACAQSIIADLGKLVLSSQRIDEDIRQVFRHLSYAQRTTAENKARVELPVDRLPFRLLDRSGHNSDENMRQALESRRVQAHVNAAREELSQLQQGRTQSVGLKAEGQEGLAADEIRAHLALARRDYAALDWLERASSPSMGHVLNVSAAFAQVVQDLNHADRGLRRRNRPSLLVAWMAAQQDSGARHKLGSFPEIAKVIERLQAMRVRSQRLRVEPTPSSVR